MTGYLKDSSQPISITPGGSPLCKTIKQQQRRFHCENFKQNDGPSRVAHVCRGASATRTCRAWAACRAPRDPHLLARALPSRPAAAPLARPPNKGFCKTIFSFHSRRRQVSAGLSLPLCKPTPCPRSAIGLLQNAGHYFSFSALSLLDCLRRYCVSIRGKSMRGSFICLFGQHSFLVSSRVHLCAL